MAPRTYAPPPRPSMSGPGSAEVGMRVEGDAPVAPTCSHPPPSSASPLPAAAGRSRTHSYVSRFSHT
eukprot:CAMPEP_0173130654 /NCGR_PEP_ID=MMETSP1102-20130122/60168_1 /TAXON_ID=49646 /ORGANISM="Geminigera sp., Strain Caron Lab Isolate" /LENGTH=66 /DNA_ID=CAMNT_0014041809 /DNA_START=308 /DNA_END=508 /DNA_ORIENTATION=-